MPDKLKPCPFCGGEVESMAVSFGVAGVITCTNCKTKFVIPWNEAETSNDLFNAWNKRVENDRTRKETAEKILEDFDNHGVYSKDYTNFMRKQFGVKVDE